LADPAVIALADPAVIALADPAVIALADPAVIAFAEPAVIALVVLSLFAATAKAGSVLAISDAPRMTPILAPLAVRIFFLLV